MINTGADSKCSVSDAGRPPRECELSYLDLQQHRNRNDSLSAEILLLLPKNRSKGPQRLYVTGLMDVIDTLLIGVPSPACCGEFHGTLCRVQQVQTPEAVSGGVVPGLLT